VKIDLKTLPVDYLTMSGHKIGAPKGIGAMYIRRGTPLEPLMHGGSQDRGRRPGTENVAYAVGFAVAAELALAEADAECTRLERLRDQLEAALLEKIPDAVVHGRGGTRAPHILNVSVPGTNSEAMLMALDLRGVACSAGSACQSGSVAPSHVLAAMGVPAQLASAAIRMSLGATTSDADVARVAEVFPALVNKARRLSGVA
jgi:cysteine desulfurase